MSNFPLVAKNLTVRGLMVYNFKKEWPQAFTEMNKYIQEVSFELKLQVRVDINNLITY